MFTAKSELSRASSVIMRFITRLASLASRTDSTSRSAAMAKLIASKDKPPFDLLMVDSPNMPDLIAADVIEKITPKEVANTATLYPQLKEFGDYGIPFVISSMPLYYNKEKLLSNGDPLEFLVTEGGARSITDAAYRYARHERGADVILFGTGNKAHVADNVASILRPALPPAIIERLHASFGHLSGVGLDLPGPVTGAG